MKKNTIKIGLLTSCVGLGLLFSSCSGGGELAETTQESVINEAAIIPIATALEVVARENDIARTLYTKGVVGPGKAAGINFHEDWRKEDVEAGPLPALFLRGVSSSIQKGSVPLGLYLGSDFTINKANKFVGKQAELFAEIRKDSTWKYFFDEDTKLHTAMFPDFASAMPCVTCHNEHEQTTKTDWKLNDIMGATTWTYPNEKLTLEEAKSLVVAYREGIVATLGEYVTEINGFKVSPKPEIGTKWPTAGAFIPSPEAFLDSVVALSSVQSLDELLTSNLKLKDAVVQK